MQANTSQTAGNANSQGLGKNDKIGLNGWI
jgi:hypothetical protein